MRILVLLLLMQKCKFCTFKEVLRRGTPSDEPAKKSLRDAVPMNKAENTMTSNP